MFVNLVLFIARLTPKSPKGDLAKPTVFKPEPRARNQEPGQFAITRLFNSISYFNVFPYFHIFPYFNIFQKVSEKEPGAKLTPKSPKGDLAKPAVFQPEPRAKNQEPGPFAITQLFNFISYFNVFPYFHIFPYFNIFQKVSEKEPGARFTPKSPKGDFAKQAVFKPEPGARNQEPRPAVLLIPKWLTPKPLFLLFTFYFLLSTISLHAQLLTPLSHEMNRRVEYEMMKTGTPFFTVLKPYLDFQLWGNARQDSLNLFEELGTKSQDTGLAVSLIPKPLTPKPLTRNTWLTRKLFHESFVQVDSGHYYLFFDPVFELGLGKEIAGRNTYINTRGFRAGGRLGKHLAFGADFYENQGKFNSVVSEQIRKKMIAPGEGMARKYDSTGFDFAYSSGYISMTLLKKLNLVLSQGRQFIGDGYRSMLLSDASYTYPSLKFTWISDKFFYAWDNLLLQDWGIPIAGKKTPLRRKSVTIHNFGINIKNKVQLTIVKMQLYNNPDSFGDYKIRFNQLNPLLIPEVNNKNSHAIWGANIKISPLPNVSLYNQWAFDNFLSKVTKRVSVQVGAKYYASLGNHRFYIQAEYNRVPPLTYTSGNKIYNWLHLREPLAHPYGHNFDEFVLISSWSYKRLQFYAQVNVAKQLENITDTKPYTQATLPYYPNNKKLDSYKTEISYFINPKTLMNISVGYNYRNEQLTTEAGNMHYVYLSFGTRLFNKYYDF